MIRCLFRSARFFTKITPQIYPEIKTQFETHGTINSLGAYFTNENAEDLLNIIIESKISPTQSNKAL